VYLSFQLSAAGQTYFAATNVANLGAGADLSAIEMVLAGMSIFSGGDFTLANAQWDNASLPSVLTLTVTPQAGGAQYQVTAIAATIADTLNNYFGNVGAATFTPVGMPGTGTITTAQAVASSLTLNPSTILSSDIALLTGGTAAAAAAATATPSPSTTTTGTSFWVWLLALGFALFVVYEVV
jgi:hypothetical protein